MCDHSLQLNCSGRALVAEDIPPGRGIQTAIGVPPPTQPSPAGQCGGGGRGPHPGGGTAGERAGDRRRHGSRPRRRRARAPGPRSPPPDQPTGKPHLVNVHPGGLWPRPIGRPGRHHHPSNPMGRVPSSQRGTLPDWRRGGGGARPPAWAPLILCPFTERSRGPSRPAMHPPPSRQ